MRRWVFLCVVLCLAAVLPVGAQIATGKIEGKVSDDKGPLPGVTITVSSPSLQGNRTSVSGANGDFSIPLLPPGEYTVRFELSGYQPLEEKVKVNAAQVTRVDALMQQGTFTEEVVVTGAFEPVSTTSREVKVVPLSRESNVLKRLLELPTPAIGNGLVHLGENASRPLQLGSKPGQVLRLLRRLSPPW
ncbi:MAG: carboxypeptidase-like regulatory domain-containing protein [Thermoanaerobaculum sp.]